MEHRAVNEWYAGLEKAHGQPQQSFEDVEQQAKRLLGACIVAEECIRKHDLVGNPNRALIGRELAGVLFATHAAARYFKIPLQAMFGAVHKSRMGDGDEDILSDRISELLKLYDEMEAPNCPD